MYMNMATYQIQNIVLQIMSQCVLKHKPYTSSSCNTGESYNLVQEGAKVRLN